MGEQRIQETLIVSMRKVHLRIAEAAICELAHFFPLPASPAAGLDVESSLPTWTSVWLEIAVVGEPVGCKVSKVVFSKFNWVNLWVGVALVLILRIALLVIYFFTFWEISPVVSFTLRPSSVRWCISALLFT